MTKSNPLRPQPARVLIVEDDALQAEAIRQTLAQDERLATQVAFSAHEAGELLTSEHRAAIALIVLDLDLEGAGMGYSVLAAAGRGRRIPVLVLTGRPTTEIDERASLSGGAAAYMSKPYSPRILLDQVINLIEVSGRLLDVFDFGNGYSFDQRRGLILNPRGVVATLGDAQHLILSAFVAARGRALTAPELVNALYGRPDEDRDLLYKAIYRLRDLLEGAHIPLKIETLGGGRAGASYLLVAETGKAE